jgi:hypothetical protein
MVDPQQLGDGAPECDTTTDLEHARALGTTEGLSGGIAAPRLTWRQREHKRKEAKTGNSAPFLHFVY